MLRRLFLIKRSCLYLHTQGASCASPRERSSSAGSASGSSYWPARSAGFRASPHAGVASSACPALPDPASRATQIPPLLPDRCPSSAEYQFRVEACNSLHAVSFFATALFTDEGANISVCRPITTVIPAALIWWGASFTPQQQYLKVELHWHAPVRPQVAIVQLFRQLMH